MCRCARSHGGKENSTALQPGKGLSPSAIHVLSAEGRAVSSAIHPTVTRSRWDFKDLEQNRNQTTESQNQNY